jgi:hypothetical protein
MEDTTSDRVVVFHLIVLAVLVLGWVWSWESYIEQCEVGPDETFRTLCRLGIRIPSAEIAADLKYFDEVKTMFNIVCPTRLKIGFAISCCLFASPTCIKQLCKSGNLSFY